MQIKPLSGVVYLVHIFRNWQDKKEFLGEITLPSWLTVCDSIEKNKHNIKVVQMGRVVTFSKKTDKGVTDLQLKVINQTRLNFKFGFLNIYKGGTVDPCDTLGDIYAWNISDWAFDARIENVVNKHHFLSDELCFGKTLLKIVLPYQKAINFLAYNTDDSRMIDVGLEFESPGNFVPYESNNGIYVNHYTQERINATWWDIGLGQPDRLEDELCVSVRQKNLYHTFSCRKPLPVYFQMKNLAVFLLRYQNQCRQKGLTMRNHLAASVTGLNRDFRELV